MSDYFSMFAGSVLVPVLAAVVEMHPNYLYGFEREPAPSVLWRFYFSGEVF